MNYWLSSVNGPELEKEGAEIPKFTEFECQPSLEGLRVLVLQAGNTEHLISFYGACDRQNSDD